MTSLSIRARMLLAALLPVTLVATLLAAVFLVLRVGDNQDSHMQHARLQIRQVASASEYGVFSGNIASLQALASGALKQSGQADARAIVITDARGVVLVRAGQPLHAGLPALLGQETEQVDTVLQTDRFTQPILAGEVRLDEAPEILRSAGAMTPQLLGHVVMEFSRDSLNRREREMVALGVAITVGGLLFGGLLGAWMGRSVIQPILRVSRMIVQIGQGQLSVRHAVLPNDPLRDVQTGLNQMAERLEASREEMTQRIAAATLELREKKEEAELATLAKSQFLAAASHDLRQPTHALGMFVARLGQLPHDAQTRHLVSNLDASVQAMQDLLDGLLDISKLDAGAMQVNLRAVSVNTLFDQVRRAMANTAADKGLRLRVRPTRVWVHSDPVLLHRILLNLVSNAVRYTRQGSVLVTCRAPAASEGGGLARIEVWDSGIGIAPEHHRLVFKEFFQVGNLERDRIKGMGLGLNIVERAALLLGHPLHLRSSLGRGSRFTVEVPVTVAPSPDGNTRQRERRVINSLEGLQVLVIEDDVLAREAMVGLLASWGCKVMAADGAQAALRHTAQQGIPDVIISDYRLRDGDTGMDVIRAVRAAAGRPVAACLTSGNTEPELIQRARDEGLTLLHKPVRPAKLRSLLRSLVTGIQGDPNVDGGRLEV